MVDRAFSQILAVKLVYQGVLADLVSPILLMCIFPTPNFQYM